MPRETKYWYDEKDDNEAPTYSIAELELRASVLKKALSVLDKNNDGKIDPEQYSVPLTTRVSNLEDELIGNLGAVYYYLVSQGFITLESAENLQRLPKAAQMETILNYLKPDND